MSLCVYEAVPHVGAQLDHCVEVGSASRMLRAVSCVLHLGTKPTQLLRVVDIVQSLLNDVDNCESVPRCVNMFRSASHFHSGFCRVLDLPLQVATAAPHSDVPRCSYWIIQFVEAGYFLRDNFAELGKSFEDPYTHETYDLSQVLASFFESKFIDQATLNGTRPNSPLRVKPATTGAGLGRHAVPRRRSGASCFGPRPHGPEAHGEGSNRGRRLRGRRVDGGPRPPMPSRAYVPAGRPPAALMSGLRAALHKRRVTQSDRVEPVTKRRA